MRVSLKLLGVVTGVAIWCCLLAATPAMAQWEWQLIPYLWASDVSVDIETPQGGGGTQVDFSDLFDKVDLAFQVHLEGQRGRLGFFLDLTAIDAGDEKNATGVGFPPLPEGTFAFTDVDLLILEVGGIARLKEADRHTVDLLYGARIIELDLRFDITPPFPGAPATRVESGDSFTDGMVGFRYLGSLSDKWSFLFRGDYATGDTDGTLNAMTGLFYRFGKSDRFTLRFGYRHMEVELEEDAAEIELEFSGPLAGLQIDFGG